MEISIAAEKLFSIGSFPVTNALLVAVIISIGLAFCIQLIVRRRKLVPKGAQNLVEVVFEGLFSFVEEVLGDKEHARRAFPLIATIFLFVLFSNWVSILPGLSTIGLHHMEAGKAGVIPFLRSTSADLNFTLALSLIVVLTIQVTGIMTLGFFKYGKKFFVSPFHKPYVLGTMVGFLELVSEVVKFISFSFRLFGNIFAGEILLTVMLTLLPYFIPLPFLLLETFVGLVQAGVFAMLTLVFLKMAMLEAEH